MGALESLATVTVTLDDVVVLVAPSRATADRVCRPLAAVAVFQLTAKGATVSSAPRFAPLSLNCTPATPTLSVADAVTVIVPATVAPAAGEVTNTDGAVVSGGGGGGGPPVSNCEGTRTMNASSRLPPRFVVQMKY